MPLARSQPLRKDDAMVCAAATVEHPSLAGAPCVGRQGAREEVMPSHCRGRRRNPLHYVKEPLRSGTTPIRSPHNNPEL